MFQRLLGTSVGILRGGSGRPADRASTTRTSTRPARRGSTTAGPGGRRPTRCPTTRRALGRRTGCRRSTRGRSWSAPPRRWHRTTAHWSGSPTSGRNVGVVVARTLVAASALETLCRSRTRGSPRRPAPGSPEITRGLGRQLQGDGSAEPDVGLERFELVVHVDRPLERGPGPGEGDVAIGDDAGIGGQEAARCTRRVDHLPRRADGSRAMQVPRLAEPGRSRPGVRRCGPEWRPWTHPSVVDPMRMSRDRANHADQLADPGLLESCRGRAACGSLPGKMTRG